MSVKSIRALKRDEARQRMADLRRARRSRRSVLAVQRRSSYFGDAAKWRLTNLAEVLKAMSRWLIPSIADFASAWLPMGCAEAVGAMLPDV